MYLPLFLLSSSFDTYDRSEYVPIDAGGIRFANDDILGVEGLKSFIVDMEVQHESVFNMDEYKDNMVEFQFSFDSSETLDAVVHFNV